MSSTNTPNMSLIVPTVGAEAGPQYAFDVNNSLYLIDSHNHTPGQGVQIPPAGLNINTSLPFQNNFATGMAGMTLIAQTSIPADNTLYESGVDLYWVDALGNNIQLTKDGAVAGTPGSIANLTSPASATYVSASSTFVWQSNAGIAANMDFGSAIMRNLSPNSTYALTLSPPTLSSNYSITLPTLPLVKSVMQIDSSGNITDTSAFDGVTIQDTGTVIQVAPGGIGSTQLAANAVQTSNIAAGAVNYSEINSAVYGLSINPQSVAFTGAGSYNWTVPAGVTRCIVYAVGGGGGGGGGGQLNAGSSGSAGGNTLFNSSIVAMGGNPGAGGAASGGSGGGGGIGPNYADFYFGGAGSSAGVNGLNGQPSQYFSGGFGGGGVGTGDSGGGGGGGASSFAPGGTGGTNNSVNPSAGILGSGGGGGGGGGVGSGYNTAGGGGGAGGKSSITIFSVIPSAVIPIVIGAGGSGGSGGGGGAGSNGQNGDSGGDGAIYIYY